MHEVTESHQIFQFWCHSCDHRWSEEFDLRSGSMSGNEFVHYFEHGVAVTAPYDGVPCPGCGDPHGKVASVVTKPMSTRTLPPQRRDA